MGGESGSPQQAALDHAVRQGYVRPDQVAQAVAAFGVEGAFARLVANLAPAQAAELRAVREQGFGVADASGVDAPTVAGGSRPPLSGVDVDAATAAGPSAGSGARARPG